MQKIILNVTLVCLLTMGAVNAEPDRKTAELHYIRQELQQLIDINIKYQQKFSEVVSEQMLKKQIPDATIVLCSDSRVDMNSINQTPAGQLFTVRNIGNQVQTAYGSVEYGVNHLHTPMLIVVGHSGCGAVQAAMNDYSAESSNIKRELDFLEVDAKESLNKNIIHNVNNQIRLAVEDFQDLVRDGKLLVIGLIYDIHNDYKQGSGKIILVNINNETDPTALSQNPYVKGLKNLVILK